MSLTATKSVEFTYNELDVSAKEKSRFYIFGDQIIDGERKEPSGMYLSAKEKVKFDRLIEFKKSFLPALFRTSKENVLK